MTNTEAIKVLNSYCSERYLADTSLQEACSVAVEALQAQAESEDAISREMALKECHDIVIDGERYRVIQEETLLGLPPVRQQESKTDVIDKIKAEIDEISLSEPIMSIDGLNCYGAKSISIGHFREKVFEIIDKYAEVTGNEKI